MRIHNLNSIRRSLHKYVAIHLVVLALSGLHTSQASELAQDIRICTQVNDATKRLSCYDRVAKEYQLIEEAEYIAPPEKFLSSKLTVTPWHSEYSLTVQGFVTLIENAVMANGDKIEIHGWTRQDHDYVLNITMRRPLHLRFLPFETATDEIPLSLLRSIIIDGEETDPELFITTIASMIPDNSSRHPEK